MPSQGEHRSGWRFVGAGRRLRPHHLCFPCWEPCLSMLPASSIYLFPLAPCSSPLLSLCPSVSPSSLPHLLHPLLWPLTESHCSPPLLSQTPAHSSLGLSHPLLLLAFFLPGLSVCLSVQWHHVFLFTCLSSLPCQPCLSPSPSLSPSAFREGSGDL